MNGVYSILVLILPWNSIDPMPIRVMVPYKIAKCRLELSMISFRAPNKPKRTKLKLLTVFPGSAMNCDKR